MADMLTRRFVQEFDVPLDQVWNLVADTRRLSEVTGVPKHQIEEIEQPDGSVIFNATAKLGPFDVAWVDHPQNWVTHRWLEHHRDWTAGPLARMNIRVEFEPLDNGCRVTTELQGQPANWMLVPIIKGAMLPNVEKAFGDAYEQMREFLTGRSDNEYPLPPVKLADGVPAKVAALVAEIEATKYGHGLAQQLAEFVTTHLESECMTLRPRRLARIWDVPERLAIEVCLEAARAGLLGSRWQILCPRCQGGKGEVHMLGELPTGVHCPSCNIDYERDFAKNVELAFHPSQSIRPIEGGEFCLFGPMTLPNIKVQLTVPAGARRAEAAELTPGTYRLRTLEPGGENVIEWEGGGFPEIVAEGMEVRAGPPAEPGTVAFDNRTGQSRVFIVEEFGWRRDVLTAHRVTTMQAFRELFDEDVLRPGDSVDIDSVTLMFTDFKGSTALYERIGDSRAYRLIREFFEVLGGAVRAHDGTIVKTIGDAVNAAFANPADALACAVRIQDDVETFNASSGKEPITVTIGLHVGRCISVTLNGQLDYYGTAANKAARLEGESQGGDIVFSKEFRDDPTVQGAMTAFTPVPGTAMLKGFDGPVEYFRITAEELASRRGHASL